MPRTPPRGAPVVRWNLSKLTAAFGGVELLIKAHASVGFDMLTYGQVANWRIRHQVPADRLLELLFTLQKMHGNVNIWDYTVVVDKAP